MKSKIAGLTVIALACLAGPGLAADGKALFEENGCTSCHRPDATLVGPSLTEIADAYEDRDVLAEFLNGERDPVVQPARFSMMKPNLNITKKLSSEERSAMAEYILGYGK